MTGAERGWASQYQIEDVVRYSRGSKVAGIEPRSYGTVVAVNAVENLPIPDRAENRSARPGGGVLETGIGEKTAVT